MNYGLAVLARAVDPASGGDVHLGVLLPFHHFLKQLDGVQVLVAQATPSAARPQLRSMLEALLCIEYIAETGPETLQYALRACAYVVGYRLTVLKTLRAHRRYDSSTPEGQALLGRQMVGASIKLSMAEIDENIARIEAKLDKPPGPMSGMP